MYLKLGLLTITCLVCLVTSTPQYYEEGYSDPYYYDRQNPAYGQYDPAYYPQYSGERIRSVKPEQNQGTTRKPAHSSKGPKPANSQGQPINGQAYPPNSGAGVPNGQAYPQGGSGAPNGQAYPQGGSGAPNGQGYPNAGGNDYGYDTGLPFPNGPSHSTGGSNKKPGFESHYSDTQHFSGSRGRVNYETNIQNNFHYVENTERNFYVIPSRGGAPKPANKGNKNKQDKNKSLSWF